MGPVKSEKPVQRTTRITSFEYLGQKWGVFESLTFLHSLGFADSACQLRDALWLDDLQNRFLVKPLIYLEKNDGVLTGRRKNFELGVFLKFGWGNKRWKGYTEESNLGLAMALQLLDVCQRWAKKYLQLKETHSVCLGCVSLPFIVEGGPSLSLQSNEISSDADEAETW